jgi:hypothetical protein
VSFVGQSLRSHHEESRTGFVPERVGLQVGVERQENKTLLLLVLVARFAMPAKAN